MPELPVAEDRIVGRVTGGDLDDLTPAEALSILEPFTSLLPLWDGHAIVTQKTAGQATLLDLTDEAGTTVVSARVFTKTGYLNLGVQGGDADSVAELTLFGGAGQNIDLYTDSSESHISAQAGTGQTAALLTLLSSGGTTNFSIGPDGQITKCNNVAVPITGVPVTAAGVHAALVSLGLITA